MSNIDALVTIRDHTPGYRQHWIYVENDRPVMAVGRYETGGQKTYRQFHFDHTDVVEGMPPSPYPLFGLSSLKNPSPLQAVVICEGEKCATALHQLGWPAVTSPLGANSTEQTDWLPLRYYKRFIILRDNDKSGVDFARSVSAELYRMQPNIDIQVVNLSPDRNGGDVVDWLQTTVLCGQKWDGFSSIPESLISPARTALCERINDLMVKVEDCPHVAFKPVEALFEGPPKDFDVKLRDVLPFPIHVLPGTVREYLEFISAQVSQTTDFAATAFIAAICGLIGRSTHLKMRPFDEWYETANCWAILVGRPSTKKSPILRRTLDLFKELEVRAASQFASASKKYKAEKRQAEIDEVDFDEPEPKRRRYTTDDVTMPKLRELMAANPNGIILRNDELKGQLERLEKIGSEGDRSFMMSCWSGLEVYSEDRMCRDSHINIPLALTWIGCIPPAPLQRYLREAMGRGSGADGFMQRFQFICFPEVKREYVLPTEPISMEIISQIQQLVVEIDDSVRERQRTLVFTDDAQKRFDDWLVQHENNTRSGDHPIYWESHLGKQATALAILTIFLHRLSEGILGRKQDAVELETLEGALLLLQYYESHARRCYDSVVGATVDDAKTIISLLKTKRLPSRFKAQDIYHQGLGGLSESKKVCPALDLLQDYGWLILEKIGKGGGRKNQFWILNPRAFETC